MSELTSTIAGYPRIGRHRELKKALEAYWRGKLDEETFEQEVSQVVHAAFSAYVAHGLRGSLPDSSTLYDHVLDTTVLLGSIPERFSGKTGLDLYFSLARGDAAHLPLEMTKYFDTNYHYLVPEIGPDTTVALTDRRIIERAQALRHEGIDVRPVLVGPVTWLALAKGSEPGYEPLSRVADAVEAFKDVLRELAKAGIDWVQIDEPALVSGNLAVSQSRIAEEIVRAYSELAELSVPDQRPQIFLNFPYGDSSAYSERIGATGVEAIGIDAVRGCVPEGADLSGITLAVGVVDGRNIWRSDLAQAREKLQAAQKTGARIVASTSTSLQHVPHTLADEHWDSAELNSNLHSWLAFADEKIDEIALLAQGLEEGWETVEAEIAHASEVLAQRAEATGVEVPDIRRRVVQYAHSRDRAPYSQRVAAQDSLHLPIYPTTTIGSFPQTREIRSARAAAAKGEITEAEYTQEMRAEIERVIRLQEEIGLDVLVHGEPERNDMVQYFGEQLTGFDVTKNGWVQSYGSRCTRPSILWGDVERAQPMTVQWWKYAQSLTDKPVKGMLTGPVTIIAWSFVRDDIALGSVADQIALALRDEIVDLETAGARIIQVDEPALRELLPLDQHKHEDYINWAVGAFTLATSGACEGTQIHTHLCYSEFGQIIGAIADLDADVTSIEAARSKMEVLQDLACNGFNHQIGPGVWDIHSPRVPSVEEITALLEQAAHVIDQKRLWVNPDCGLKTRAYEETIATLKNIVAAAKKLRARF